VGVTRRDGATSAGPTRLAVRGLCLPAPDEHGVALKDISIEVRSGEIVGVAGVAGNGQGELFEALSGERPAREAGAVILDGVEAGHLPINARRRRGAAFVPEERLGHATAPALSLSDNAIISGHATNGFVRHGLIDRTAALGWVDRVVAAFDVRKGPRDPAARALSGGNLQKFIVGRELLREPGVLVISQPTWGVDAGAAQMIRQALVDRARAGAAVLVISQDLDELFEISDRVAVMFHGRLSAAQAAQDLTREAVGLLMGGAGFQSHEEAPACAS
jgi:simple sugar transport system ATP-binding protein